MQFLYAIGVLTLLLPAFALFERSSMDDLSPPPTEDTFRPTVVAQADDTTSPRAVTPVKLLTQPDFFPLTQALYNDESVISPVVYTAGVTEQVLNQRMVGLLSHVRWLLDNQAPAVRVSLDNRADYDEGLVKQVERLEKQIFSFMDESSDDLSDAKEDITQSGTLTDPTLVDPTAEGTFYIDGNLGVGTSSPSDTLAVAGAVYLGQVTPVNTVSRLYNTSGNLYWNGSLIGGGAVGSWTSSGGGVYRATGNVGIGTSTPYVKLSVDGNVAITGGIYDNTATRGANGQVLQTTGTGITWVATSSLGYTEGTVTNVSLSAPTGFTVSGSPVTTTGALALLYSAGYEGLLTASSTNWNTFYNTPSSQITDGTGLTWSGDTLNLNNDYGANINVTELASEDFGDFTCNGTTCSLDAAYLTTVDISTDTNLTIGALGIQLSGDDIALSAGYSIPLTSSTTNWNTAFNWGDHSASSYLINITGESFTDLSDTQASLTANRLIFTNSGGTALTDIATLVFDGTNLGIGTTTPTSKLTVAGNALFQSAITEANALTVNNHQGTTIFNVDTATYLTSVQGTTTEATLGVDLVTNGTFTTNDTGWTSSGNWSHDAGNDEMDYTGSGGAVEAVAINHGGTGYTVSDVVTITGGNTDATATVDTVSSGKVTAISITAAGTGYAHDDTTTVTGGTGSGLILAITDIADGNTLVQDAGVTNGNAYQLIFTTKNESGTGKMQVSMGGVTNTLINNRANYSLTINSVSTASLTFTPTADWTGTIDDVTVKLIETTSPTFVYNNEDGTTGLEVRSGGSGLNNIFMGVSAGQVNTTGTNNNATGYQALYANTTGYSNNATGYQALFANTTGNNNSAIGYQALYTNTTGYRNSATGYQALYANTTGHNNNATGQQALFANTTGYYNNATGQQALHFNTTGSNNNATGYRALYANTTGHNNNATGYQALYTNTTGYRNSATGYQALYANTTGWGNNATGQQALYANTTGNYNSATGRDALHFNTTGNYNNATGYQALYYNGAATNTVAIGHQTARGTALYSNQGGTYLGYQSGYSASTSSDYNTMLGYKSGYGVTTGANNILIGRGVGYSGTNLTTGSNNIMLGYNIGATSVGMSNALNIGNLIFGTGIDGAGTTLSTGNIGIGTSSLLAKLSIQTTGTTDILNLFEAGGAEVFTVLESGNIGIGTTTPSSRLTVYDGSSDAQLRVSYDEANFIEFTTSATGDLTLSASGGDVSLLDENLSVCSGGACPATAISGTGNLVVENTIVANNYQQICPAGYVWVPGSAKYGTKPGFCVMKYEASNGGASTATSDASNTPWVSISQETARAECSELGLGYHLISEMEAMTIVENIATTPINDMDADAGPQFATGHSDNVPALALAATTITGADPVVSGCDLTLDMENATNAYVASSCEIRGDGTYGGDSSDHGFSGTGQAWSATGYSAGAANKSQLRTNVLSNGEVIWDFTGNVWDWTDEIMNIDDMPEDATPASEWLEYTSVIKYRALNYIRPPDDAWSSTNGVGRVYTDVGDTSGSVRAFIRGGSWSDGSYAGLFTLYLDGAPSYASTSIGFRCAL